MYCTQFETKMYPFYPSKAKNTWFQIDQSIIWVILWFCWIFSPIKRLLTISKNLHFKNQVDFCLFCKMNEFIYIIGNCVKRIFQRIFMISSKYLIDSKIHSYWFFVCSSSLPFYVHNLIEWKPCIYKNVLVVIVIHAH